MKKMFYSTVISVIFFAGCMSKVSNTYTSDSTQVGGADEKIAVCIWDKVSLKEEIGTDAKWLASINLGEKCAYLDDTKEDNSGKKLVSYYKIKLQDGKEGWAQSDFIILNSKPAALIAEADVYSRPDLLTKTDKTYSAMDIVAVKSEQNGFVEVTGKRKGGKWIESGWIRPDNISYADVDIAVAKFAVTALAQTDEALRMQKINDILGNHDLESSVFIQALTDMITPVPKADTLAQ